MLEIEISKIRDDSLVDSLRQLCKLRSDFKCCVYAMMMIDELLKAKNFGKAANNIQLQMCEHKDPVIELNNKVQYDDSLESCMADTHVFETLSVINYKCFEDIPEELTESLKGLVVFESTDVLALML